MSADITNPTTDQIIASALRLPPADRVQIVTALEQSFAGAIDLAERGIDQRQAADLRHRLKPFADDWDRPEMDVYDAV
jgi:hypothetical protein